MSKFVKSFFNNLFQTIVVIIIVLMPLAIGFVRFANGLPLPTDDPTQTDAIVVLTGGSDRISTGLTLLEAGRAKKLFVSGVNPRVELTDLLKIDRSAVPTSAAVVSRIELGHTAGDTFGNSVETVDWMRANGFHTMRLVTADYHMKRALIEFRMAAPDIEILPNPVQPASTVNGRWWRDRPTFDLLLLEYGKYLVVKWRYRLSKLTD